MTRTSPDGVRTDRDESRGNTYAEIFAMAPTPLLIAGIDGAIVDANRAAATLIGRSREALLAVEPWSWISAESRGIVQGLLADLKCGAKADAVVDAPAAQDGGEPLRARFSLLPDDPQRLLVSLEPRSGPDGIRDGLAQSKESAARLRTILESIPVQIWYAYPDGRVEFQNTRWQEYTGLAARDACGWAWRETVHPDDLEAYVCRYSEILRSGQPGEAEARLRRHDGAYRWFMTRLTPVVDEHCEIARWSGTNTDIEDRKVVEDALRRNEAYLARAQALSRTGSFGWNVRSDALFWSDETYCIVGFDRSVEPTVALVLERTWEDDLPLVQQALEAARAGVQILDFESRLRMPDGKPRYVHILAHACNDPAGDTVFVGAITDVTARKHSEQALLRTQARFERILEIAEDAIISIDASYRIVLFNRGAVRTFGYESTEVLGQPIDILMPPDAGAAHRQHLEAFAGNCQVSRQMADRREIFGLRKDGTRFPAEASISKLELDDEQVFTVILRDITERKRMIENMLASERFARSQADALVGAVDVLSREPDPKKIVEHMFVTLTGQLGAQSGSIWLRGDDDLLSFSFAYEDGQLKTGDDPHLADISPSLPIDAVWPWPQVFRTGRSILLEDVKLGEDFPWRAHILAQGIISVLVVPMLKADKVAGVLGIRFDHKASCSPDQVALAQALANQCMLAIQLMRLMDETRHTSTLMERNRIARDLHDTIAQGLTGVIVQLEAAADASARGLRTDADDHAARARELARESLQDARRSVNALRPRPLEEKDLCVALRDLADRLTHGTGTDVEFKVYGRPLLLQPRWEENLLRIGQEAVTNAVRHGSPTRLSIHLAFEPAVLKLSLRDNGKGFVPERRHDGFGLRGMTERVGEMGGEIMIDSKLGVGTEVLVVLPVKDAAGGDGAGR